ncbi:hypothetical protein ACFW1P_32780 [Paenibacillus sp. NPDC058910]
MKRKIRNGLLFKKYFPVRKYMIDTFVEGKELVPIAEKDKNMIELTIR